MTSGVPLRPRIAGSDAVKRLCVAIELLESPSERKAPTRTCPHVSLREAEKAFFADLSEHTLTLARTSSAVPPFEVEEIQVCAAGDQPALAEAIKAIHPEKTGEAISSGLSCGIYPTRRVVRRVSLDLKRIKDTGYLNEIATQQLRIEPDHHALSILHASDGSEYDLAQAAGKEVIMCGLPSEDVNQTQDQLLATGLFPDRLELGTLATLGVLADYLAFTKNQAPTLVLEIEAENTPVVHRLGERVGNHPRDAAGGERDDPGGAEGVEPEGRRIGAEAVFLERLRFHRDRVAADPRAC